MLPHLQPPFETPIDLMKASDKVFLHQEAQRIANLRKVEQQQNIANLHRIWHGVDISGSMPRMPKMPRMPRIKGLPSGIQKDVDRLMDDADRMVDDAQSMVDDALRAASLPSHFTPERRIAKRKTATPARKAPLSLWVPLTVTAVALTVLATLLLLL